MYWLQLTQVSTGSSIFVNMEHVLVIAPNKSGGSSLVLSVAESAKSGDRVVCRIVQVVQTQDEIMAMFNQSE